MKIHNLEPQKYKRFFSFGCSFTNYIWPTWADIIGQDIEIYENWGDPGGGNFFIFNSLIEANLKYKFKEGDLVVIMWTNKEREDRYSNNKWIHAYPETVEKEYGKDWVKKYFLDNRAFLIRDLAVMSAAQEILNSTRCDWANLIWHSLFTSSQFKDEIAKRWNQASVEEQKQIKSWWVDKSRQIYKGEIIDETFYMFDDTDVLEQYQQVFENISGVYDWFEHEKISNRVAPNNDRHPTPSEALMFLDWIWPENTLSVHSRKYAADWNEKIFLDQRIPYRTVKRL